MDIDILDNPSLLLSGDIQNDAESVKLSPLTQYINAINQLIVKSGIDSHTDKGHLFFRGQANKDWNVSPSIFRDGQLSLEHKYIRSAISRLPDEFSGSITAFNRLTKLQHYGLPTRLLDVTLNPLVALYFACQEYKLDKPENEKLVDSYSDGAVYIAYANPELPESLGTQVLSSIASFDLSQITLKKLWGKLSSFFIGITQPSEETIMKKFQEYTRSHFVLSDLSNERLIRQSGAFLVCGCINITMQNNAMESFVSKAERDMKSEFSIKITIDADEKDEILDELDFYNINEATLFPETEHQLRYIADSNKKYAQGIEEYRGIICSDVLDEKESVFGIDTQAYVKNHVMDYIKLSIRDIKVAKELEAFITQNASVDWISRENIQSKLISGIKRILIQNGYTQIVSKKTADSIIRQLRDGALRKDEHAVS